MTERKYDPNHPTSVEVRSHDEQFQWPETAVLHEGVLEDTDTGDILSVSRQPGTEKVVVGKKTSKHPFAVVRTAEAPRMKAADTLADRPPKSGGLASFRVEKQGPTMARSGISDRRRAEHQELVAQARAKIGDPDTMARRLVRSRLGTTDSQVISEYLEEKLGRGRSDTLDDPNGR